MRKRIVQPHVDPGRAGDAVAGHPVMPQGAQHRLLEPVDVFLDEVAGALQVDHRIGDHLPRPVVRHLAAAVGGDDRDVAGREQVIGPAGQALREHGWVLAQPQLVGRVGCTAGGERLHLRVRGLVPDPPADLDAHYRTILTIGCVDSVRYSSSSCSRLVAVMVIVMPR